MSENGRVILYVGGPVESRERLIFAGVPITPKTLVLSTCANKQRMKALWADHCDVKQRSRTSVQPLFNADKVSFAGYGDEANRLLDARKFDHIIVANVNEMLRPEAGMIHWVYRLGLVARKTQATLIVDIPPSALRNPLWWEASLGALGLREPDIVSFWINTLGSPVRYLRLEQRALDSISKVYFSQEQSFGSEFYKVEISQ